MKKPIEKMSRTASELIHPRWWINDTTLNNIKQKSFAPEHVALVQTHLKWYRTLNRIGVATRIVVDALLIQTMIAMMGGAETQVIFASLMVLRLLSHQLHLSTTALASKDVSDLESHLTYIINSHKHTLSNHPNISFEKMQSYPETLMSQISAAEKTGDAQRETLVNLSALIGYVYYLGLPLEASLALVSAVISEIAGHVYTKRIKPIQNELNETKKKIKEMALFKARTGSSGSDDILSLLTETQLANVRERVPLNLSWYLLDSLAVTMGNFISNINAAVNLLIGKNISGILAYSTSYITDTIDGQRALKELQEILDFIDSMDWQIVTAEDWHNFAKTKQPVDTKVVQDLPPGLHAINLATYKVNRETGKVAPVEQPTNCYLEEGSVNTLVAPSGMGKSLFVGTLAQELKYDGNIGIIDYTGNFTALTDLPFDQIKKTIQYIPCSHFSSSLSLYEEVKRAVSIDADILLHYIKNYFPEHIPGLPFERIQKLLHAAIDTTATKNKKTLAIKLLQRFLFNGTDVSASLDKLSAQEKYEVQKLIEIITTTIKNLIAFELEKSQLFMNDAQSLTTVPMNNLSGGERARMAMILGGLHPAKIITFDEPFDLISNTQQHQTRKIAAEYSNRLAQEGKTILLITHLSQFEQVEFIHSLNNFKHEFRLNPGGNVTQHEVTESPDNLLGSSITTQVDTIISSDFKRILTTDVRLLYIKTLNKLSRLINEYQTTQLPPYVESVDFITQELFSGLIVLEKFFYDHFEVPLYSEFREDELYDTLLELTTASEFLYAMIEISTSADTSFKLVIINEQLKKILNNFRTHNNLFLKPQDAQMLVAMRAANLYKN